MPKRSSPAVHCWRASETSSRVRATKFHHMSTGSEKGTPPSRSAAGGLVETERTLVAARAQIGQDTGLDHGVGGTLHGDPPVEDDQRVLVLSSERHEYVRRPQHELGPHVIRVAAGR